jgi:lysyl-tRNA synthetase class I
MNKIITIERVFLWAKCILFCERCDTNTVHALSKSGEYYNCGCGSQIFVELKGGND